MIKNSKKLYCIWVMIILAVFCFGCGDNEETATVEEGSSKSEEYTTEYDSETERPEIIEQYTLTDIANLNGVSQDDLYIKYSGDYVSFMGCSYSDMVVNNEDDALYSIGYISDLIGATGLNLTFNRKDVSPITNNVYYTFFQTQDVTIDDTQISARFFTNLLKVITDSEGCILGL